MNILFIGTGNMASALIKGLITQKVFQKNEIIGLDVDKKKLAQTCRHFGIKQAFDLKTGMAMASFILLATKPQQLREVMDQMAPHLKSTHQIISIAAGIDLKTLETHLGSKTKIVRVMPNTPALVGLGASAYCLNKNCRPADKKNIQKIFEAVGLACEVKNEAQLDAVTGLSGSGPAYVYQFIDGLIEGGIAEKLPPTLAKQLALQTVLGATQLLKESNQTPQELTAKVASKGGTTEAGLKVLAKRNFKKILGQCIQAATLRSRTLRS